MNILFRIKSVSCSLALLGTNLTAYILDNYPVLYRDLIVMNMISTESSKIKVLRGQKEWDMVFNPFKCQLIHVTKTKMYTNVSTSFMTKSLIQFQMINS